MSSSTTGNVTEEHHNFISIMAIDRRKISAPSPKVKKTCDQRSTYGSLYKRHDEHQNIVSCRELHLCGGPEGDIGNGPNLEKGENGEPASKTKGTQTDYRESATQTSPWEAPYKLILRANENPEILSLAKSTWGNGLPAGIHEVQIIQRMRMKRAWLRALPEMDSLDNIKTREAITAAIEANEWAFREAEIQCIMDTRMELMERIAKNKSQEKKEQTDKRIERYAKHLSQLRDKQINNIRGNFLREVRKLTVKHGASTVTSKMHRSDFIARYAIAKSDVYANKIRFSGKIEKPHKILSKTLRETCLNGEMEMDDATKWLPVNQPLFGARQDSKPEELCPRQTRWSDEKLRKLHADLKAIRLNTSNIVESDVPSLLKRKLKVRKLPVTPTTRGNDSSDNYWENCSLFIQKITRGRAIQCMMFEGRNRCRELIEELQSTRALQESTAVSRRNDKTNKFSRDFEENDKDTQDNRISEILDSLEGMTVAGMLDMLSKEDTRLREERRAHGFVLLAERERNRREAAESGRRQLERNRRRELDEMFRQIVKVHQDSVEAYLEDIIKEGIEWVSDDQARQYVMELADKIDASTSQSADHDDRTKDEELIADMVHNFLLPEVDKEMIREKIRLRQQGYIRDARIAIYNEMIKSTEKIEIFPDIQETENQLPQETEDLSLSEVLSID